MLEAQYPNLCANCKTADECRRAFGRFWLDRSDNGVGCNHPFPGYVRATPPPAAIYTTASKTKHRSK